MMEEPGRLQSMGSQSQTRLSDFTLTFHFHALEKETATHSSVLAWRIPGTGEPGELPAMVSHSRTRLKRLSSSSRMPAIAAELNESCLGAPLGIQAWVKWVERMRKYRSRKRTCR